MKTTKGEVERFLKDFSVKTGIFQLIFLDERGKNAQALLDLDITPNKRKEVINSLKSEDYSDGPLEEKMRGYMPMWVFGKEVKNQEVYIKISMGTKNSNTICISFHLAERAMNYPFK
jgi:hypothetical protein